MARTTHLGACPLDCPDTCAWELTVEDGRAVAHARRPRPPVHPRRALRQGQPLPRRGQRAGPADLPAGARRAEGRRAGLVPPATLGRGDRAGSAAGLRATIDRDGPEAILPYYFAGTMGQVQGWTMGPRLFAHLGASRLRTTICTAAAPGRAAARSTAGRSASSRSRSSRRALIVLWGANLLSTNLHQWPFVLEAQRARRVRRRHRPAAHRHRGAAATSTSRRCPAPTPPWPSG